MLAGRMLLQRNTNIMEQSFGCPEEGSWWFISLTTTVKNPSHLYQQSKDLFNVQTIAIGGYSSLLILKLVIGNKESFIKYVWHKSRETSAFEFHLLLHNLRSAKLCWSIFWHLIIDVGSFWDHSCKCLLEGRDLLPASNILTELWFSYCRLMNRHATCLLKLGSSFWWVILLFSLFIQYRQFINLSRSLAAPVSCNFEDVLPKSLWPSRLYSTSGRNLVTLIQSSMNF